VVVDALSRSGFGPTVRPLILFPAESEAGVVLVARRERQAILGSASCVSFGATGWIGALAVAPEARRRGLGAALTRAAIAWLQERGASTVLLYATEMGRPVYERLGFESEGTATAWRGSAGAGPRGIALRTLRDEDAQAMREVDETATGERREAVLGELGTFAGMAADRDGGLAGWAVGSRWGVGVSIAARDADTGVALMAAATRGSQTSVLIVPDANAAATEALRRWDFQVANRAERMRFGPAVTWHPERQFGLFNLFWG